MNDFIMNINNWKYDAQNDMFSLVHLDHGMNTVFDFKIYVTDTIPDLIKLGVKQGIRIFVLTTNDKILKSSITLDECLSAAADYFDRVIMEKRVDKQPPLLYMAIKDIKTWEWNHHTDRYILDVYMNDDSCLHFTLISKLRINDETNLQDPIYPVYWTLHINGVHLIGSCNIQTCLADAADYYLMQYQEIQKKCPFA